VEEKGRIGSIAYRDLILRWQNSSFIEDERVPFDAEVIGHTWKHPNKNGGPDRRFANNHQIPICLYEALHFSSLSGLNELVQISRTDIGASLAVSISSLKSTLVSGSYKPPALPKPLGISGPGMGLRPIDRPVISEQNFHREVRPRQSAWSFVMTVFLSFLAGAVIVAMARPVLNWAGAVEWLDTDRSSSSVKPDSVRVNSR
jgi:hypothetical protein